MNTRRTDETLASAARATGAQVRRPDPLRGALREAIGDEIGRPERDHRPAPEAAADPDTRGTRVATIREMLASRSALRQAIILTEILGPPKSLRRDR